MRVASLRGRRARRSAALQRSRARRWAAALAGAGLLIPLLGLGQSVGIGTVGLPERLLDGTSRLGGGPHRSRGCFWLPSRPDRALEWAGSGGQFSIGDHGPWGRRARGTRLLVTGLHPAPVLQPAFDDLLVTDHEPARDWALDEDGFEPWLGPVRRAA